MATIYVILLVFLNLLFIPFLGGKKLFTRQFMVQIGKSTLIILSVKGKIPTLAGKKHLSVHFFPHGPRLFHLWTEKGTRPIREKCTSKWLLPSQRKK